MHTQTYFYIKGRSLLPLVRFNIDFDLEVVLEKDLDWSEIFKKS